MIMKYVILDWAGLELPVIFPDTFQHKDMAAGRKVVSAGYLVLNFDKEIKAGGDSLSLGVTSRPEDSALIEKFLKGRA